MLPTISASTVGSAMSPVAAQSTTKLAPVPPLTSEVGMNTSTVENGFSATGDLR